MNPEEATSLKQLFLSIIPKNGDIVVGTVTKESPLTIQIENDEKLEISGSALLVPRNLTDYQVKVDIASRMAKSTATPMLAERTATSFS